MTRNTSKTGTGFASRPDAIGGNVLRAEVLDGGRVRVSIRYPVSISGKRTEYRELGAVLDAGDRSALTSWLVDQRHANGQPLPDIYTPG